LFGVVRQYLPNNSERLGRLPGNHLPLRFLPLGLSLRPEEARGTGGALGDSGPCWAMSSFSARSQWERSSPSGRPDSSQRARARWAIASWEGEGVGVVLIVK
jgi:hypothetical protein